jgi:16S rRNA (cytidine1402-2'-O)-methyltransferase
MNKGKLFLVGMPIGNWEDMSVRAYNYIKNAKNIVIEREEAFREIWPALNLDRSDANIISIEFESNEGEPTGIPYELHNAGKILDLLNNGEDVFVVSDEGMPGVADPGAHIVAEAIKAGVEITATPGPSVVIAAVSVTGTMHNFTFDSFLPFEREDKREFLKQRAGLATPLVLVLRTVKNTDGPNPVSIFSNEIPEFLEDACEIFGSNRHAALCYNLTRKDEKVVRGTLKYLKDYFATEEKNLRDQITVVIDKKFGSMAI